MYVDKNFPHPDQLVSSQDLSELTQLSQRFWEARRISGDTPPYIRISKRAVRYRWGDVVEWLNKRMRNNTADIGQ
jgi:predicted DNA-binding transcriptional regulator AlpA